MAVDGSYQNSGIECAGLIKVRDLDRNLDSADMDLCQRIAPGSPCKALITQLADHVHTLLAKIRWAAGFHARCSCPENSAKQVGLDSACGLQSVWSSPLALSRTLPFS